MLIRRATTAISTIIVAILLALTVPTSQLRTVAIVSECCCPDPDNCHCPPPGPCSDHSAMRACHSHRTVVVSPTVTAFTDPVAVEAISPTAPSRAVPATRLASQYDSPDPRRPSAPS